MELLFQEVYILDEVDVVGSGNLGSIGMVVLKGQTRMFAGTVQKMATTSEIAI